MNQTENLFIPANFFMLRVPTYTFERFYEQMKDEEIKVKLLSLFSNDALFRQAILIASPELYRQMQRFQEKDPKEQEQLIASLLKYFVRMSTRPTPFGLFSFVGLGSWEGSPFLRIKHARLKKRARPDMEWLLKVIDQIISDPSHLLNLPLRTNPLLTMTNGRIHLKYLRKKNNEDEVKVISIRSNVLVKTILGEAKSSILVCDLENEIFKKFPTLDRTKTRSLIQQLIEQQILVSTLCPSLLTETPFEDFLNNLAQAKINFQNLPALLEIQKEIQIYNTSDLDKGEEVILHLVELMEAIVKSPNYLQVDLGTSEKIDCLIPELVKEEITQAAAFAWNLSLMIRENESDIFKQYHTKFLDKYGISRRVPLLELLDECGLGIPEHYQESNKFKSNSAQLPNRWDRWLKNQWSQCLHEKKKEICLNNELFKNLKFTKKSNIPPPLSFDLQCSIMAESEEHLTSGNYQINLISLSSTAGSFFGRFLDIFGNDAKKSLKCLYDAEEQLIEHSRWIETSYLPHSTRSANVAIQPKLRNHRLDLSDHLQNSIQIEDVFVGADEEGFYLTTSEGTTELIFHSGNMLSLQISPIPIRFIRDVSLVRHGIFHNSYWKDLYDVPFLPRLSFNKTILSPAQWQLDLNKIEAYENKSDSFLELKLAEWMDRWNVPRYVFLAEFDNHILLDRFSRFHIKQIIQKLKANATIKLVEKIDQSNIANWLQSELGSHSNELVIPFLLNPTIAKSRRKKNLTFSQVSDAKVTNRLKCLGSDWLYLKIYLPKESHERFLINHIGPLAQHLVEQDIIKKWFFIRYHDPDQGDHLRIRFISNKEKILNSLIPMLHEWTLPLFQERMIKDIVFGTYERELERYGGEDLIESVEDYFCVDTVTTIDLLQLSPTKKIDLPNYILAALSLIDFSEIFWATNENKRAPFANETEKEALKGFREWKKKLIALASFIIGDPLKPPIDEESFLLRNALEKRKGNLQQLSALIHAKEQRDSSFSSLPIFHSLIHMHCNRLLGMESQLEKKGRQFADSTYIGLKYSQLNQDSLSPEPV